MNFAEFLIVESMTSEIKAIADQVIDQFADEQTWNTDAMVASVMDQLRQDPRFQDESMLKSAESFLYHYLG